MQCAAQPGGAMGVQTAPSSNSRRAMPCSGNRQQQRQRQSVAAAAAVPEHQSRRGVLTAAAGAVLLAAQAAQAAVPVPPAPQIGDCFECIGEVNETLNACPLDAASCVSTLNDDEAHFSAPWEFDGSREAAVDALIAVVTGGQYEAGLIDSFGGIKQTDAAAYIAKGVLAVATGGNMPDQPKRQRKARADQVPFDGVVVDRHTTPSGAEYVRVVLGTAGGTATSVDNPSMVMDAEFLFLAGDNLVNVRAASRVPPEGRGQLALSYTDGLVFDKNVAGRRLDTLRTALRWELAPIIADFSPQFNAEAPTFVEKLFQFNRPEFEPSGITYPIEGGK